MLVGLSSLDQLLYARNYDKYVKIVRKLMFEKQRKNEDQFSSRLKTLKTFSIGKLMQLSPIMMADLNNK